MHRNFTFFVLFILIFATAAALAATSKKSAAPTADTIIKKLRERNTALKSYSFNVHRLDLADEFVLRRNEEGLKSYKEILDKLSFLTRQSKDISDGVKGYKESRSNVLFMKPYSLQYYMEKSDFVPSFLQKSKIVYRPDVNDADIFLKEPYLGMLIRNDVKNESATALIMNWTYELMELDCALANGGVATAAGTDTYDSRQAYLLNVTLLKGKIPWAVGCGGKSKDLPKNAYTQISRELGMMAARIDENDSEKGYIRYWVDAKSWVIVKKEVMFGKTAAIRYEITDLNFNSVKPGDMIAVKKSD